MNVGIEYSSRAVIFCAHELQVDIIQFESVIFVVGLCEKKKTETFDSHFKSYDLPTLHLPDLCMQIDPNSPKNMSKS